MSEDHQPSTSSSTSVGIPLSQHSTSDIISTESLMFPSNGIGITSSALSSASPMLSQGLMAIQGLDSGEATSSFTVGDIVASTGSDTEGLGVTEYQLVDGGNGELIVVTSTIPHKVAGLAEVNPSMGEQAQTITLNLEEATQLLLQQQGLGRAVQLSDGSLQILGQSLDDKESLPLEVLTALQGQFVQTLPNGMEASYCLTDAGSILEDKHETMKVETINDASDGGHKEADKEMEVSINDCETNQVGLKKEMITIITTDTAHEKDFTSAADNEHAKGETSEGEEMLAEEQTENFAGDQTTHPDSIGIPEEKVPDMNSPIPVTDQTIVMIKGKKCVLAFNEETQQMCAYPIKRPAGKKRGRPKLSHEDKVALAERRKQERERIPSVEAPSEQNSAAETLLELSSIGANGVRRSARKRKKAKLLEEYEELEDSDEDEPFVDNQEKDPDITMHLPDLKKKRLMGKDEAIPTTPSVFLTPVVKRGRGRPRRYPPPGQSHTPTSIPAVIIPSANGQTLVMTELQGFGSLRNFQRQLPNLVPKPPVEISISQGPPEATEMSSLPLGGESDPLHLGTSEGLDSQTMIPTALQGDSVPLVGADGLEVMDNTTTPDGDKLKEEQQQQASSMGQDPDPLNQPTVIQIPENLLPMLGIKKDPIKIGLKASERELEKLKCPKCDFQGFYAHQYRAHIATHGDDIHKCKCCSYVSLDSDELLGHFKEFHPRCICPECDFMAEHAYIIKRHMMRHNAKSCTCHICGKVYKDMYILKMHVKMVHMPAEVLFECNVCCKKFTRKAHLKRHLRIHEPEKPFKCPHCEYRGCERSDISKHMLIHEEPKHVCERCGKTFRHIKNKELHVKRHYGQRDYKCGVCDFFGYTFTDIRKHIERKHQDMKTLICDKCNKHFRSELSLKEHQQVCNVMMIEQILAIPTSGGGTSQATIQIPAIVGPDGQRIILDGQTMAIEGQNIPLGTHTVCVDGKTVSVTKQGDMDIMVTEQPLGLPSGEVVDEEELLELDDEEGSMNQTMHIIGETIMTESGEQLRIISHHEPLTEAAGGHHHHHQAIDIGEDTIITHHDDDGQQGASSLAVVLPDDEAVVNIGNVDGSTATVTTTSTGGLGHGVVTGVVGMAGGQEAFIVHEAHKQEVLSDADEVVTSLQSQLQQQQQHSEHHMVVPSGDNQMEVTVGEGNLPGQGEKNITDLQSCSS